jgi:hypothetical protein
MPLSLGLIVLMSIGLRNWSDQPLPQLLMHGEGPSPVPTTSFARDVVPVFHPVNVQHMRARGGDLTNFDAVRSRPR